MTAQDAGRTATLFVTNVLNGTVAASPDVVVGGTVVRIGLSMPAAGPRRSPPRPSSASAYPSAPTRPP